ncbi:hypothetical protein A8O14_05525 [Polynucleobacter wuianus]|uniref:MobA-like NTP transferase domain-containing protein n=1 Tax=Polynucleobacter wuianus TaxID=1743168 RepID=A0A191UIA8_9BURK|nr:hypothetical protein A8O14_05525 [Polynucleobacter wuianus]MBU3551775.1 nucleotidyltransferase family protein [Polynucleobacter sp. MWH-Post4-6-1]MBU3610744.1 nucleotidyltransferase family protein [Polynucleobacter wuianus]
MVLLAAGEGSRMGSIPKALLLKDGKTLLQGFCEMVQELRPVEFVVLTGFHAQAIEAELAKIGKALNIAVTVQHNFNAQNGQGSSVRLALESLQSQFDVLAVCLSDQPNIGHEEIEYLLGQFSKRQTNQEIIMPEVNGQRGNPVLFSKKAVENILSIPGMVCRAYMDQHPELITVCEIDNPAYVLDADTEADIQKLGITRA